MSSVMRRTSASIFGIRMSRVVHTCAAIETIAAHGLANAQQGLAELE